MCGSGGVFESCTFYLHDGRANRGCRVRSSAKCSLPRVHVTHPYSRVSITSAFSMLNFKANGAASISYSSRFATLVPASQMYELYIDYYDCGIYCCPSTTTYTLRVRVYAIYMYIYPRNIYTRYIYIGGPRTG